MTPRKKDEIALTQEALNTIGHTMAVGLTEHEVSVWNGCLDELAKRLREMPPTITVEELAGVMTEMRREEP